MNVKRKSQYRAVVGLEIHVQLSTVSKIFCDDAASYGAEANTHISPYTLGYPGTLPMLNKKVIEHAARLGMACQSTIADTIHFSRKNYFYPDLPKGYQITQDKSPICTGGRISFLRPDGIATAVRIRQIHIEEDSGKSIHPGNKAETLLDFNRAGVPLLEIVTEPDLTGSEEAASLLREVRKLVRFLEISDGNMEEGSLRCDVNVSLQPDRGGAPGNRVELKNINSIKRVRKAIDHEIRRQKDILEKGGQILPETRIFEMDSEMSQHLRKKEQLDDYRFFPDPDISPVCISEAWKGQIASEMPATPEIYRKKFVREYGLTLANAEFLTESKALTAYFDRVCQSTAHYKTALHLIAGPVHSLIHKLSCNFEALEIPPEHMAVVVDLIEGGMINKSLGVQKLLRVMIDNPGVAPASLAKSESLIQQRDEKSIDELVKEILSEYPGYVQQYRAGKKGLLGMFMGELMKRTKGHADPEFASRIFRKYLD